jgi:hypothetical protein
VNDQEGRRRSSEPGGNEPRRTETRVRALLQLQCHLIVARYLKLGPSHVPQLNLAGMCSFLLPSGICRCFTNRARAGVPLWYV